MLCRIHSFKVVIIIKNKFITSFHGYVCLEDEPQTRRKGMKLNMDNSIINVGLLKQIHSFLKDCDSLRYLDPNIFENIDKSKGNYGDWKRAIEVNK